MNHQVTAEEVSGSGGCRQEAPVRGGNISWLNLKLVADKLPNQQQSPGKREMIYARAVAQLIDVCLLTFYLFLFYFLPHPSIKAAAAASPISLAGLNN